MAVNKRKILESAQKHLQKGALDKALEDYQTLLKADPKDSNTRLKVGDLHLKLGRTQDAIDAYLRVAQQFTNEGFDAKAVALYKQIAKLDDKRFEVHAQLGELYQRMGLASEAMKALQAAADGAYRAGDKNTALGLLRRMAALDPTNTTSRLKVADLLRAEGKTDDAISEYEEVARELARQNAGEERLRVLERQLELAPERAATLRALAEAATACGAHERACVAARKLASAAPDDNELLELLGKTLEAAGQQDEAAASFRALAERLRERGDEDRARADAALRLGRQDVRRRRVRAGGARRRRLRPRARSRDRRIARARRGGRRERFASARRLGRRVERFPRGHARSRVLRRLAERSRRECARGLRR